ncbi:uncharacterized protein CIMG_05108 [Coccidioides immitis RS]|uniref:Uncharacterized protein n=2 Tax=Coccidioides immitis TaxID=5501 RepID=J3KEW7_COCIM|nr:uncharacterized protein CIMG_05108 [Coccidioides immitis RS]EAS34084.3 hypothetical protein CIMG_05108 [Coccidioides immitis RS]KMU85767.1 hypothetical protein CIHG_03806 [Coccidioides immitis H538.4]
MSQRRLEGPGGFKTICSVGSGWKRKNKNQQGGKSEARVGIGLLRLRGETEQTGLFGRLIATHTHTEAAAAAANDDDDDDDNRHHHHQRQLASATSNRGDLRADPSAISAASWFATDPKELV